MQEGASLSIWSLELTGKQACAMQLCTKSWELEKKKRLPHPDRGRWSGKASWEDWALAGGLMGE